MSLTVLFSTAFVVALSGALMPGPVTAVTAEYALKRGITAAPLIALGHGLMEALVVALLLFGLGRVMESPQVTGVIGIAGGAVLAWMGWGMIRGARSGSVTLVARAGAVEASTVGPVSAGILSTLANPYWFLWWATVGAGYLALSRQHGVAGVLLFFGGHILADLSWLLVLAVVFVTGRRFINDRIYAGIVGGLGAFLIALAAFFLWMGAAWLARLS